MAINCSTEGGGEMNNSSKLPTCELKALRMIVIVEKGSI